MRLKDAVAIITGAGRGIGRAAALRFGVEGARVAVLDIDAGAAAGTAAEIIAAGGRALGLRVDVTQAAAVAEAFAQVLAWGARIDVLVNNAGITRDARLLKMTEEQWDAVISVNLKGTWLCGRAAAAQMVAQGSGSIINVSSIVGVYGNFGQSNYAATKGGVIAMSKTWARELGPAGVRCNVVAPGFIATEMTQSIPERVITQVIERTPLRRMGTPEELAAVYVFLASDDAAFVNGAVIGVDGGLVA